MTHSTSLRRAILAVMLASLISSAAQAITADALRKQLASASSSITDLKGAMVVKPASKANASEINKGVLQFLNQGFREATLYYKRPDKYKAEGKAKGVDITYVINGNTEQFIAPALMLKRTQNLSRDRDKKQSTLGLGFASDGLWLDNKVTVVSERKGIVQLRLVPFGTTDKRKELVWIELKTLKLVKRERYGGGGNLKARYVYAGHKTMGRMPVATMVKAYAPDGGYAGSISYSNVKVNTGMRDSVFGIK